MIRVFSVKKFTLHSWYTGGSSSWTIGVRCYRQRQRPQFVGDFSLHAAGARPSSATGTRIIRRDPNEIRAYASMRGCSVKQKATCHQTYCGRRICNSMNDRHVYLAYKLQYQSTHVNVLDSIFDVHSSTNCSISHTCKRVGFDF